MRLFLLSMTGKPHHELSPTWLPKQDLNNDNTTPADMVICMKEISSFLPIIKSYRQLTATKRVEISFPQG